jgi:hypothetical protein
VLLLSGTSTIAGDVRYPDGTPVVPDELGGLNGPVLTVSALPRDVAAQPPLGVRPQTVLNRTDGRFTIVNVAPGRYRVRARLLGAVRPAAERGPTAGC